MSIFDPAQRPSRSLKDRVTPVRGFVRSVNGTRPDGNGNVTVNVAAGGSGVGAKAWRTTAQSIPNATWTAVTLSSSEDFDSGLLHDLIANPSRFVVPAGGLYLASALLSYVPASGGDRYLAFAKNGTRSQLTHMPNQGAAAVQVTYSEVFSMSTGDYLEVHTFQDSGGALSLPGALMSVVQIGA